MTFKDYVLLVSPVITMAVAILGWHVINKQNNKREDRKELKSAIDSIISEIHSIETQAIDYYKVDPSEDSPIIERALKKRIDLLEQHIKLLQKMNTKHFGKIEKSVEYRRVITGGDFEQQSRKAKPPSNDKFLELSMISKELIRELEDCYIKEIYSK
jgi:hypothetical protein